MIITHTQTHPPTPTHTRKHAYTQTHTQTQIPPSATPSPTASIFFSRKRIAQVYVHLHSKRLFNRGEKKITWRESMVREEKKTDQRVGFYLLWKKKRFIPKKQSGLMPSVRFQSVPDIFLAIHGWVILLRKGSLSSFESFFCGGEKSDSALMRRLTHLKQIKHWKCWNYSHQKCKRTFHCKFVLSFASLTRFLFPNPPAPPPLLFVVAVFFFSS